MDLRCPGRKHAVVLGAAQGTIEILCRSRVCGAGNGSVVLHRWDLTTGYLTETLTYKNPNKGDEG